jgi:hypothetical protein
MVLGRKSTTIEKIKNSQFHATHFGVLLMNVTPQRVAAPHIAPYGPFWPIIALISIPIFLNVFSP